MPRITFNLLGPQGSGKGTQAKALVNRFGFQLFDAGENLRRVKATGSPLGQEIASYIDRGLKVPPELIARVTESVIKDFPTDHDILFDGLLRALPEIDAQRPTFEHLGLPLPVIIYLNIDKQTAMERIARRRICENCKTPHIVDENGQPDRCSKCGGKLIMRHDDTPEAIEERLGWYYRDTMQVIDYFAAHGTVIEVDGRPSIEAVSHDLITKVESYYREQGLSIPAAEPVDPVGDSEMSSDV